TASPRHPASRLRLDCHVSSLRDLPRNDSTGPGIRKLRRTTPPIHSTPCHCEERSDAAIQRTASGIPHHDPDWIATPCRARNDKRACGA
ncbi:MAG: hypothetical protein O3A82_12685, partial [Verrucomicrobia bacterium]|nr:hypothetical protein [Verrucomicrobiota bacterium]